MKVDGLTGSIELFSDFVCIHRPGFINKILQGNEITIPISQIDEIQIRKPTSLTAGGIQFFFSEVRMDKTGTEKIIKHSSLVVFAIKQLQQMADLKDKIIQLKAA
ncbi:MAG: hypothetical protein TUN42_02615 [Dehalogenimonas sp.]